jgi:hypothetical protein
METSTGKAARDFASPVPSRRGKALRISSTSWSRKISGSPLNKQNIEFNSLTFLMLLVNSFVQISLPQREFVAQRIG